jgi:hypothetical protein
VLEHTPDGGKILAHAFDLLEPSGWLVLTCATNPRLPHSAIDGGDVCEDEWYQNVEPTWLQDSLVKLGFLIREFRVIASLGDLYAVAQRPATSA